MYLFAQLIFYSISITIDIHRIWLFKIIPLRPSYSLNIFSISFLTDEYYKILLKAKAKLHQLYRNINCNYYLPNINHYSFHSFSFLKAVSFSFFTSFFFLLIYFFVSSNDFMIYQLLPYSLITTNIPIYSKDNSPLFLLLFSLKFVF